MQLRDFFTDLFKQFLSLILLTAFLSGAFSAAAQNRGSQGTVRKRPDSAQTKKVPVIKSNESYMSGWSGVINYEQRLEMTKTWKSPVTAKGHNRQETTYDMSYEGKMIVDGSDPKSVVANGRVKYSNVYQRHENSVTIDSCHANETHEFVVDDKIEDVEEGKGGGLAQTFYLNFDERLGTYNLSFTFPEIPAKFNRKITGTRSGHCQPKNNEPVNGGEKRDTVIRGGNGSVENQKIDPNNPDVLQGSIVIDNNDRNQPDAIKVPIIKISWKLRRCSPPLVITDVKFYHLNFPSPSTWEEVDARRNHYTIDGNDVKIVATIANLSGAKKSATVNFKDLTDNKDLPQANVSASFEPHEEKEVEYVWDTSGYAWKESSPQNYPVNSRNIEVRIPDDQKNESIFIYPKPVVLIPGMWSKPEKFALLAGYFKNQNVPWATVVPPVYVKKTAASNAPIIDTTVREIQERENAWHVDLVAHSTGGLMARAYVDSLMPTQYDNRPTALHLLMLGTPNLGTPCAAGADGVVAKIFKRDPEALGELSDKNMQVFNNTVTRRNGTKFMAVVSKESSPTCQLDEPGDGIVPMISALYTSRDYFYVNLPHENLGGGQTVFTQVRKWLALPPSANFAPDNAVSLQNSGGERKAGNNEELSVNDFNAVFRPASFQTTNFPTIVDDEPNFATGIRLAANASSEIEIPITAGTRFSLVLYASPDVSATLIDEKGEILGKSLMGTPESTGVFRTINVKKPFQNGKWKLKLESRGQTESEIIVTAFIDYTPPVYTTKAMAQRAEPVF